jgi:hypothetical protein
MTETIVKIIGAVILLVTSVYYGQVKITAERIRIKKLSAARDMVKFIGEKIEHFSSPIPEILSEYRNSYLESIGYLEVIRTYGLSKTTDILGTSQKGTEYILIKQFVDSIGKGYKDDEVSLCKYTHLKLTECEEKLSSALKDKEKLYRTIPLMLALSVILILI